MFSNKYGSFLTVILVISIIAIVVLLGFLGYDMYQKYYIEKENKEAINQFDEQIRENENNNEQVNNNNTEIGESGGGSLSEGIQSANYSQGGGGNSSSYVSWDECIVIGTIKIPATGVECPIYDRITKTSLEKAIVLVSPNSSKEGEPILNQPLNTTLAGHNYRNGTFFSNNKKLKEGDLIYIKDTSGRTVKYEIYQKQELSENDPTYINRDTGGKREISLTTCTENAATRLVIFAREK